MFLLSKSAKTPQCLACIHQILQNELSLSLSPFRTQVRGKKKVRLPTTINVKLLKDIRGYGRQGAVVPVAPGRMRNIWYPSKRAQYMTVAQLKSIPDLVIERDFTYGMEEATEVEDSATAAMPEPGNVQIKLLSPQRASQLVDEFVPEYLDFYRPAIANTESEKTPRSESQRATRTAASSAAEELAEASESLPKPEATAIYGSVSTADIAASIKAFMMQRGDSMETEEAARVVLNDEDIRVVQDEGAEGAELGEELDRIKRLGEFNIDIQVKGGETVRRIVRVKAQR